MEVRKDMDGLSAGVYLRKSRMEEGLDTEEVLRRHREGLLECAARHGLYIEDWYPEVVSGESLYARPQMLRLLEDVEAGRYDAVLVMDLDRLSRGRMKDQGIILDAFKDSGTRIVTPDKVYDLSDEIDDELAEFKTFMSRREYKIINKRLRRGLYRSIQDGCYVANAPYGYKKTVVDRRPTLEIYEPEAEFVRVMYRMYAEGYGCMSIANQVNAMGARPHRSTEFSRSSVAQILKNPTYVGKVVWNQKSHIKKNSRGNPKHITIYNPRDKWIITDGLHPAIIEKELYDKVQSIMEGRYRPAYQDGTVKSSLAGLVYCSHCGKHMQRMNMKGTAYLLCMKKDCCAAAKFEFVENRVIECLEKKLEEMDVNPPEKERNTEPMEEAIATMKREQANAVKQKSRLYDLLELGEYDLPTYRERMAVMKERLQRLEESIADAERKLETERGNDGEAQRKQIETVLSTYHTADAAGRNALLHTVIERIDYTKKKKTKPTNFALSVTLKPF